MYTRYALPFIAIGYTTRTESSLSPHLATTSLTTNLTRHRHSSLLCNHSPFHRHARTNALPVRRAKYGGVADGNVDSDLTQRYNRFRE